MAGQQPPSNVGDDLGLGFALPGGVPTDAQGRRKVHPISPVVHAVTAIPIGIIIVIAFGSGGLFAGDARVLAMAAVALVLVPFVVGAAAYLSWRKLSYWFDADGDFRVDSGVITRKERRLQLSRLQSVDVAQPLFARLFSLAEVSVEVAGQQGSKVSLRFLTLDEARSLRNEILARSAGLRHDTAEAPETPIATVAPRDLAVSLLMRSVTFFLLLVTVVILVVTVMASGWGGLGLALVTGGVPILIVVTEFITFFNFTVSQSPDGLRLRFGLAKTQSRTVPPGRVQAIEFVEPLLWRKRGWMRVRVNIAGMGAADSSGNREETLLIPVATREVAHGIVERVLPGLDLAGMEWHPAPDRARRRSVIQWQRLAYAWDDSVFVARRGRVTRHVMVIPHARAQSVRFTQGPWERPLGLGSVHVDTTPGPVKVSALHLDAGVAQELVRAESDRAERARAQDRSIRWAAPDTTNEA
ncbi:MAG: PH domain-containing protein [Actinomycetota bacterium]|nr:PH domain-containing protein [Actinomycetota bacterium]